MVDVLEIIQEALPDVEIDKNGVVALSRFRVSQMLGIDPSNLVFGKMPKRLISRLSKIDFDISLLNKNEPLPLDAVKVIAEYFAFDAKNCTVNARRLYDYLIGSEAYKEKLIKPVRTSPEKLVQLKLYGQLGGEMEVSTVSGIIDLLTPTEIIEIKNVKSWKAAVGQIMVYGCDYPSHKKRIHLFGKCHSKFKAMVEDYCEKLRVVVTWGN